MEKIVKEILTALVTAVVFLPLIAVFTEFLTAVSGY